LITTFADAAETHPDVFVTVKLYVPAARPEIVLLVPDPEILPGLIVQVPVDGNPLSITLPVAKAHVGCVIIPTVGAEGVALKLIVTSSVEDVHGELDIVQRNTYVVPAVPEKVDVALALLPKLPPAPFTILQLPVPILGALPASVVVVSPHISAPV
jgi:hypothetical protein